MQKMEQALAVMREELEQEVQALSKSRSIEDRAARMAREVELNKVSVGGGTPPAAKRRSPALLEDLLVRIAMSSPSRPCFLARDFVRGIQRERCPCQIQYGLSNIGNCPEYHRKSLRLSVRTSSRRSV